MLRFLFKCVHFTCIEAERIGAIRSSFPTLATLWWTLTSALISFDCKSVWRKWSSDSPDNLLSASLSDEISFDRTAKGISLARNIELVFPIALLAFATDNYVRLWDIELRRNCNLCSPDGENWYELRPSHNFQWKAGEGRRSPVFHLPVNLVKYR